MTIFLRETLVIMNLQQNIFGIYINYANFNQFQEIKEISEISEIEQITFGFFKMRWTDGSRPRKLANTGNCRNISTCTATPRTSRR